MKTLSRAFSKRFGNGSSGSEPPPLPPRKPSKFRMGDDHQDGGGNGDTYVNNGWDDMPDPDDFVPPTAPSPKRPPRSRDFEREGYSFKDLAHHNNAGSSSGGFYSFERERSLPRSAAPSNASSSAYSWEKQQDDEDNSSSSYSLENNNSKSSTTSRWQEQSTKQPSSSNTGSRWNQTSNDAPAYSWETNKNKNNNNRSSPKRTSWRKSLSNKRLSFGASSSSNISSVNDSPGSANSCGAGCYLFFDVKNGGVLYQQWSLDGVVPDNPIAYFNPQKSIPKYRYKQNKGRIDMFKVDGNRKKLYEGVAQFCKEASTHRSIITLLPTRESMVEVYAFDVDSRVQKLLLNTAYDTIRFDCIAVVPNANLAFNGIDKTSRGFFLSTGSRHGHSLAMANT